MKKFEAIRNVVLILGMLSCFCAFVQNPISTSELRIGCWIIGLGLLIEILRTMKIFDYPGP